uniref:SAM domain-containing protein n=1 Tax=Rhodosorus marinus TaxID=101924 RepID=A0A7S3ECN3_9RHOD|mmetsp:Transcript_22450/g.90037  ORF Transcript_22450/g.90037 Transcript_22450/m.90037 type:complete len:226 (+) Transcript_22450:235-912(+)|eukprot:CAMPEP_0113968522 /NCGR_PEP_ID=MMETSP0011_2-20120614/9594_1 /TAXON_ID=101924 /ORGANISM="Rhodosorus marinus" /LENGTH=225 /DNA_ID=CAMNT_0000981649 /DNA_START=299 /DNA_END=976 /DNA_ORIENTATION=+ /assembly_acc=CAM_ASM_000156
MGRLRRWYKKLYGFEHSLWEDGGGNLVVSVDGDDTDAVVEWLERIGMGSYSAPFIEQTVDVSLLKSLSLKDLRDELGVTNMSDRRRIFNGILMLLSRDVDKYALPEDGRILTHLFNVRVFNAWIRCAVQLLIFAVAVNFLVFCDDVTFIRNCAIGACIVAIVFLLVGFWRYFVIHRVSKRVNYNMLVPSDIGLIPVLVSAAATFATFSIIVMTNFSQLDGSCKPD